MAKLFPPVIEGIVPAFYAENGYIVVVIPFSMNRAVSQSQVKGLAIKIKTVQSSSYIYSTEIKEQINYELEDACWVRAYIPAGMQQMRVGQFYKFQIAYIGQDDKVGYFSTVGVGKYTSKPDIHINQLTDGIINTHQFHYIGFYSQENGDKTEQEYSYRFDIYDENDDIIATSGDQLHNSSNDTEVYESYDEFTYSKELPMNKAYRIKYSVTTINNLEISSPRYRIMQKISIDPDLKASLAATANFDDGYITINLIGEKDSEGLEVPASGAFLLTRSCEDDNYIDWDEIARFKLAGQKPSRQLWKDFTVEQGKSYKYSIQQYNDNGLYSNRIYSNIVYSDFEDAFLFDGERQLKIKYNPKVSSFKTDLQETKIETIGSKHPFILRNGNVSYKEFPISGLISYLMDEGKYFIDGTNERSTQLTGENIAQERDFKLKVYDWLTNGKAKLFRSPGEGNYIVRLMNVSLTPNDTLGRMLHTFSATAYEVADFEYSNLNSFGFINIDDPEVPQLRFETVNLGKFNKVGDTIEYVYGYNGIIVPPNISGSGTIINSHPIYTMRLTDLNPGTRLLVTLQGGNTTPQEIQIGVTGSYYLDLGVPIKAVTFASGFIPSGQATYSYYSVQSNTFDKVDNITISEVPTRQFIGEHDVIKEIEYVYDSNTGTWVRNPKVDLIKFYNINIQKRSIEKVVGEKVFENGQEVWKYYKDKEKHYPLEEDKDIFTLYACGEWKTKQTPPKDNDDVYWPAYKPYDRFNWEFKINEYLDFSKNNVEHIQTYQPFAMIDGSEVNVKDIRDFQMSQPGKLDSLVNGNGCVMEASYQIRTIDYSIEDDPTYGVKAVKDSYLQAVQNLNNYLNSKDDITDLKEFDKNIKIYRLTVEQNYISYILALVKAQEEEKKAEGLV